MLQSLKDGQTGGIKPADLEVSFQGSTYLYKIDSGAYDDRSVGEVMHLAPTFSQNEHDGFLLSHLVRRARHTWHARFARFRG